MKRRIDNPPTLLEWFLIFAALAFVTLLTSSCARDNELPVAPHPAAMSTTNDATVSVEVDSTTTAWHSVWPMPFVDPPPAAVVMHPPLSYLQHEVDKLTAYGKPGSTRMHFVFGPDVCASVADTLWFIQYDMPDPTTDRPGQYLYVWAFHGPPPMMMPEPMDRPGHRRQEVDQP